MGKVYAFTLKDTKNDVRAAAYLRDAPGDKGQQQIKKRHRETKTMQDLLKVEFDAGPVKGEKDLGSFDAIFDWIMLQIYTPTNLDVRFVLQEHVDFVCKDWQRNFKEKIVERYEKTPRYEPFSLVDELFDLIYQDKEKGHGEGFLTFDINFSIVYMVAYHEYQKKLGNFEDKDQIITDEDIERLIDDVESGEVSKKYLLSGVRDYVLGEFYDRFEIVEKKVMEQEAPKKEVGVEKCTFEETGRTYKQQPMYRCVTCGMGKDKVICKACCNVCHQGHKVEMLGVISGFCDCKILGKCKLLR